MAATMRSGETEPLPSHTESRMGVETACLIDLELDEEVVDSVIETSTVSMLEALKA